MSQNETTDNDNDLYDRLPDYVKEEWAEQEHLQNLRSRDLDQRRRATRNRYLIEGMVVYGLAAIFGGPVGWAIGAAYGALVGFLAWKRGGGAAFAWIACVAYVPWFLLTSMGDFYGALMVAGLSSCIAAVHRMNKFDGSEC